MQRSLFISSMARSGSTLLDKLLASQPGFSVHSQPLPFLFIEAKRRFYHHIGHPDLRYPLNHYFEEERYELSQLDTFLRESLWSASDISNILVEQQGYSGQQTDRQRYGALFNMLEGHVDIIGFDHVITQLLQTISPASARFVGSKEILCEEFFPFLVARGFFAIAIIRDPRDVLTSIYFGKGEKYFGSPRPALFNLRNWRKSVAFSILLENNPNFIFIRYEDLVTKPAQVLGRIMEKLGAGEPEEDRFSGEIRDQSDTVWKGNSSHGGRSGISNKSIGSYKTRMSKSLQHYIEYICYPELKYLGYDIGANGWDESAVWEFKEPFEITREEFEADYSSNRQNLATEFERKQLLLGERQGDQRRIKSLFIDPRVFRQLANAVTG